MDIVTHAGIGLIAAAPWLGSQPALALGLAAGSVLPDLDALARVFGKRAFLRWHQTWTHALPVQAALSILAGGVAHAFGTEGFLLGAGLFAGQAFHTVLDFTNTLGVTLLAPLSRRRFCREWVFFIDAVVLLLTLAAVGVSAGRFLRTGDVPVRDAAAFFAALAGYIGAKALLRRRAGALAPEAVSLLPSALWPWRFLGVVEEATSVRLFQINALTGARTALHEQEVLDARYAELLAQIPEFALMRQLSPAYHVVKVQQTEVGERLCCRDLRTRNFSTTFGDLEVLIGPEHRIQLICFHV
jgi:membrane-bound metal-dependent hydrolase YbcI (DUF457 family)